MADFGDAFDNLADSEAWMNGGMVLAGLGASVVAKNGIDSRFDLPDEVYGVLVAAVGYMMGYDMAAVGGIAHAGIHGAERVGLKSTVEQAGA
jgi:hypothetical protein